MRYSNLGNIIRKKHQMRLVKQSTEQLFKKKMELVKIQILSKLGNKLFLKNFPISRFQGKEKRESL